MTEINAPFEGFDVAGRDGTRLRAYRAGRGPHRWLLPPGLGTPVLAWKYLFEYFQDRMTIVTWDPRGCHGSDRPADLARLAVEDHVDDAFAVMEAVRWGGERFVTGGWSMGIEVGLEFYRRAPERVLALTLINGTFEHVLTTAMGVHNAERLLGGILRGMSRASLVFGPLSGAVLSASWAPGVIRALRLVTANELFFAEVVQDFAKLDFPTYFEMILRMNEHSARGILATVAVPTLITAGTADKMTPLSVSRFMHSQIPGSELFLIPDGTHYTTIEYPEIVNLKLEQFFRRRVFGERF